MGGKGYGGLAQQLAAVAQDVGAARRTAINPL